MSMAEVKHISVQELKNNMDQDPSLHLIDVRELNEWQENRIPGAVHIPKGNITTNIGSVTTDKKAPIFLHCLGGVRSLHAAESLIHEGYQNLYSVDGGIAAWMQAGYPTII